MVTEQNVLFYFRFSALQHWNQLSRFQKNLACILLAGMCIFYVIFFVLPFNDPSRSSEVIDPMEHIQIAPFKERVIYML